MGSFSVVNNLSSVNAQAELFKTNLGLNRTLQRLSSGLRINNSGDDAAGSAIANKFRSDLAILNVGVRNANDGLSKLQIVDGSLNNIALLLDRAAALATQSASGGLLTQNERNVLDQEFQQVLAEIDRESGVAQLNAATSFTVYISNATNTTGASVGTIAVSFGAVTASSLGVTASTTNVSSATSAQSAISAISSAIVSLGGTQGTVGTAQNRLSFAINLAQAQIVNKTAAESRIRDANIAQESANLTRFNILTQSGLASLAQANQSTASVLSLLR